MDLLNSLTSLFMYIFRRIIFLIVDELSNATRPLPEVMHTIKTRAREMKELYNELGCIDMYDILRPLFSQVMFLQVPE